MSDTVLLIGSGGREHAIAQALARSPKVKTVLVSPGNGATGNPATSGSSKISNLAMEKALNGPHSDVLAACAEHKINLVVVGPEVPLAEGVADALNEAGINCFGPSKAAALIEASKAFSKDFMARHNIPTAAYKNFTDYEQAKKYLEEIDHGVVLKASGLAAGKGVLIPSNKAESLRALDELMVDCAFGTAGTEVVIEELMEGPEASIFAFSDGTNYVCMPAAQDHKRIGNGDTGPNTGGMGAYCPAPVVTPELAKKIEMTIIKPAIDGMKKEGIPFVGCLFTGVMLTKKGPMTLEYNCRLGDPETECVLPLLSENPKHTSFYDLCIACATGKLSECNVQFQDACAATVVMASQGYPGSYPKGRVITGVEKANALEGTTVFGAGVNINDRGDLCTSGGRVLTVTGIADSHTSAVAKAYAGVREIDFEGHQYRIDIARQCLPPIRKVKLAVMGSTRGTDLQALIAGIAGGGLNASIGVVISNKNDSGILGKAREHGLPTHHVAGKGLEAEQKITALLEKSGAELVLLVGWMTILSPAFVQRWAWRLMNVHPSLLPRHAGGMDTAVHQAVLEAKEGETGCTVHYVDENVDGGEIVLQKRCSVSADDTCETLKTKVQVLEGQAFIEAIQMFARGYTGERSGALEPGAKRVKK